MMARKATTFGKYKKLIAIPVLILTVLCCTQVAQSYTPPQKDGNNITYNGNVITFPDKMPPDTVFVEDPITGEIMMHVTRRQPGPVKLNGEKIYYPSELKMSNTKEGYTNISSLSSQVLKVYLLENMKSELKQLEDGRYRFGLSDIVLSKDGKIVYFKFGVLVKYIDHDGSELPNVMKEMSENTQKQFADKIARLLKDSPEYDTGTYHGKSVHSAIPDYAFDNTFTIKNGKIIKL